MPGTAGYTYCVTFPAHTTHVYQGLDVVIFGPLKHYWTQERDQFESSMRWAVNKGNFITIYAQAHQRALTPGNIHAAFQKTGVWPFNPDVVTKEMMAPSFEMSSVGRLPLPQASPVCAISAAIRQYQFEHTATGTPSAPQFCESSTSDIATVTTLDITPGVASQPIAWRMAAGEAAEALASTSTLFLVRETPLTSANRLPQFIPSPLTPTRRRKHQLLDVDPKNETERTYQDALHQSYTREDQSKAELIRVQSSVVLQAMFCERLSSQLAAQEEKQKSTHKRKGKLIGDGLPRLLTGDEFHGRVVEHEKVVVEEDKAREEQRKQRDE